MLLKNQEHQLFGQLELAHRVHLSPCHCDEDLKKMRRFYRRKSIPQILIKRPVQGMGLDKILALAKDPFAFFWNVRAFWK